MVGRIDLRLPPHHWGLQIAQHPGCGQRRLQGQRGKRGIGAASLGTQNGRHGDAIRARKWGGGSVFRDGVSTRPAQAREGLARNRPLWL
jgi:hypothetical protein